MLATTVPMMDLRLQYEPLREEILREVAAVLDSQQVCDGPACRKLEAQIVEYCRVPHAVAVSSGTDAITVTLMAMDLGCGDEVITSPFTFFATAGSMWRRGVRPVFADINPQTFNLDPRKIEEKITENTRAIMPVHLFGQMADMDAIRAIADAHGLKVIEDAAQAIGSAAHGVGPGQRSAAAILSFYPTKNLGGAGDGGMVLTPDAELAERVRTFRNHGALADDHPQKVALGGRYRHEEVGGNFRMDSVNAAYLSVKLPHLERWHEARRRNAALYNELLAGIDDLQTPVIADGNVSIYNQYVVRTPRRDALMEHLREQQVGCAVYYPLSLHEQPCFECLSYHRGDFPESERAADEVLALPIFPELTEEQVRHVADAVRGFFG
ncbi:MAG: DegT/DnrJ/EryC1/StrS family aminotransferase [Planctomycetota bacterium]